MAVDYEYFLHNFVWDPTGAPDGGPVRLPPVASVIAVLDYAGSAVSPASPGVGLFCVPGGDAIPAGATHLARGDCRTIQATAAMRNALKNATGVASVSGATLAECFFDTLQGGPDDGVNGAPPMLPGPDGFVFELAGHSPVWQESFSFDRPGQRRNQVTARIQHIFRRVMVDAEAGRLPADHHLKVLDYWCDKHKRTKGAGGQWRQFVPADLLPRVPEPQKHGTLYSRDFNTADSSTLSPGTWTEYTNLYAGGNTWEIFSNAARPDADDATAAYAIHEHALASDDQHVAIEWSNLGTNGVVGVWARADNASIANGMYAEASRIADKVRIYKRVVSVTTFLGESAYDPGVAGFLRLKCNDSNHTLYQDAATDPATTSRVSLTDTGVAGYYYSGIVGRRGTGEDARIEKFSAWDVALAASLINGGLVNGGLVNSEIAV